MSYVADNKKIPVTVKQDDLGEARDALFMNNGYRKVLAMIRQGRIFMVENDSTVTILEPFGYISKVKVKKGGRAGWVKSSWIQ